MSAEIKIADEYAVWVGRSEAATDVISPQPARVLTATLDLEDTEFSERDPLPLLSLQCETINQDLELGRYVCSQRK